MNVFRKTLLIVGALLALGAIAFAVLGLGTTVVVNTFSGKSRTAAGDRQAAETAAQNAAINQEATADEAKAAEPKSEEPVEAEAEPAEVEPAEEPAIDGEAESASNEGTAGE